MSTLLLSDAAKFLGVHPETVRDLAKRGMIPGAAKPGRSWVFLEEGLREYIHSISPCRSTASVKRGTSILARQEADLDAVLGLPTGNRRRRITKG